MSSSKDGSTISLSTKPSYCGERAGLRSDGRSPRCRHDTSSSSEVALFPRCASAAESRPVVD